VVVPASAGAGEQYTVQGADMVLALGRRQQQAERDGSGERADVRVRAGKRDLRRHSAWEKLLHAEHDGGARQLRFQFLLAAVQEDWSDVLLQQPRRADYQRPK